MPNWKKLIASGSDASLNSLNVNDGLTAGGTITANSFNGNFSGTVGNNLISANQLNVTGNGTTSQFLRSDGDGTFTWATPTNTNYFLNGITKSGNTLTFSVSGTTNRAYTFGSNAFTSYSNHVGLYDSIGSAAEVNERIDNEVIPAIPTNNNQLTNGAGYITSYVDTVDMGDGFIIEDGDGTEVRITENKEVKFVEGTGIDINWTDTSPGSDGDPYDLRITNTAPDQTVSLTGAGATSISGTYPNFTITSTDTNTDTNTQRSDVEIREVTKNQLVAGDNVTLTDEGDTIIISSTDTNTQLTDAQVRSKFSAGSNVSISAAGVISATDENTTYSAGTGLTLSGTTFSLSSTYDNYNGWDLFTDGTNRGRITSGENVNFVGGSNVSLSYSSTDNTITINSTDTNTNTTYSAGGGLTLSGTTFSHTDTSSQGSVNNSGRTYIQDITLDTYGHITGITSATETVVNTDTNTQRSDEEIREVTNNQLVAGDNVTLSVDGETIIISSTDTNTQVTNNNQIANGAGYQTSAQVNTAIQNVVDSAPAALDTLNEIAASLNDDSDFAGTMTTALAGKLSTTGKAADSNLLDGLDLGGTRANVANKVVRTDGNGYLNTGWINTTSGNTSATITDFYVNTNDGYIRKATKAHVKSQLGLGSAAYVNTSAFDAAGTAAAVEDSVHTRIDEEVLPAIPTNNNQLTNGAGYTTNTGTMSSWIIKEGNGTETTTITNGETFTIEDGTGIQSELTSTTSGGTITITNTAPDQTVSLTGAGATSISGTYPNFTITSTDTNTDTNTTYTAGGGLTLSGTTFSHTDTSSQGSVNNSGRTYIQDITLDTYGHITGITSATETVVNTDTNTQRSDAEIREVTNAQLVGAGATSVVVEGDTIVISSTDTNTNTTYSAGTGLTLSGTTFSLSSTYDNYNGWDLFTDGTSRGRITSGENVNFVGGSNVSLSYSSTNNTITINSTDTNTNTNYFLNGITKSGNTLTFSVSGTTNRTYTFGSNAFTSYSNHVGLYDSIGSAAEVNERIDNEVIPAIPTNNNQLTNGAGYITSYVNTQRSDEEIRDVAAAQWVNGTNTTVVKDDANNTIKINSTNTNTTYSAGTGLSLSGTTFSLSEPHYTFWWLNVNGEQVTKITPEAAVNFKGGENTSVSYVDEGGFYSVIVSATDTNTTYSAGGGLTLSGTTFSHTDTSSQGSVNNSGRTYIQDITLDAYGHITGITSATETVVNTDTNTTYSADGNYGMTLSGTTFRLEDDRRRNSSTTDIYTGNTHDFTFYDASVGIRWYTAGSEDMRLYDNGTLHVDGDVIAYSTTISDERLKDNITTIENPLDKIKALRGVEYDWNSGSRKGKRDLGLIAQEVEKVIPNIVHEHDMPLMDGAETDTLYKTVDYEKMVAVLIEGMKEQQSQIDELKSEISELKGKL